MSNSFAISTPGRVATQPTLKYSEEGRPRVHFRFAVDDNARTADGEWVKRQTVFHDVVAFGKSAERYAAALTVGDPVVVAGDLRFSTYEKDGEERTGSQIAATAVGPDLRMCDVTIDRNRRDTGPDRDPTVTGPGPAAPGQPAAAPANPAAAPVATAATSDSERMQQETARAYAPEAFAPTKTRTEASPRWPERLNPARPSTDLPGL